jgi:hypothetical protein
VADGVLSRNSTARPGDRPDASRASRRKRASRVRGILYAAAIAAISAPVLPAVPVSSARASAQSHRVSVDGETFRKDADGRALAVLSLGLPVQLVGTSGEWAEVTFTGWVPGSSIGSTAREGHDRIVTRGGGEDLRDAPSGEVTGRLLQGLLLDGLEDRDSWTRVSRTGWVPLSSLTPLTAAEGSFARPTAASEAARPPALVSSGRRLMIGDAPIDVHGSPDGDTIAVVQSGTPITVVERGDRWTRVRVEGWVRSDRLVTSGGDSTFVEVSAGALRANPGDYQGMRVRWTVQFVSLESAEPERTDFYEGEPFILARAPDPGDGFVYLSVPPELLDAVRELRPLETIDVVAQVRTGRSALMGVPILDLLALF